MCGHSITFYSSFECSVTFKCSQTKKNFTHYAFQVSDLKKKIFPKLYKNHVELERERKNYFALERYLTYFVAYIHCSKR